MPEKIRLHRIVALAAVFGILSPVSFAASIFAENRTTGVEITHETFLDINSASKKDLEALEGIGTVYAQKIIEGRPYKRKDELVHRNIVPKSTYEKIEKQIIVKQNHDE